MSQTGDRPERPRRTAYRYWRPITTRWMDNDVYAHVNNVVYYSFFDTVVNGWLVEQGLLEIGGEADPIGLVAGTRCDYFAPVAFPDRIDGGLAVTRIGRSSVTYAVGIFRGTDPEAAAAGAFTHVYVDRAARRPVPIPPPMRSALETLIP
ncbi:MAG: acyl-CoA thioesterase [Paracoccaceae bacterium]